MKIIFFALVDKKKIHSFTGLSERIQGKEGEVHMWYRRLKSDHQVV